MMPEEAASVLPSGQSCDAWPLCDGYFLHSDVLQLQKRAFALDSSASFATSESDEDGSNTTKPLRESAKLWRSRCWVGAARGLGLRPAARQVFAGSRPWVVGRGSLWLPDLSTHLYTSDTCSNALTIAGSPSSPQSWLQLNNYCSCLGFCVG